MSIKIYPMQPGRPAFSVLLRLVFIFSCALNANALETTNGGKQASDFQQLAMNLRPLPTDIKADFALAAITETVALYRAEAREGNRQSSAGRTASWARNVEAYSNRLQSLADSITPDSPTGIHLGPDALVYLQVSGQMVTISSPRLHQQMLLEQTITRHFCSQYPCDSLIGSYSNADYRNIKTLPHWQFRITPSPACNTGDGLELLFGDSEQLLQKRDACKRLFTEYALLAEALAQEQQQGMAVNWHRLRIESQPDAGQQKIVFNDQGQALELPLPACALSPELFNRVLPWLRSKAEGEADQGILLVITNAEHLLTALLQDPPLKNSHDAYD